MKYTKKQNAITKAITNVITKSMDTCCLLCLSCDPCSEEDKQTENCATRYCAQCNAAVHPKCMVQILRKSNPKVDWVAFIEEKLEKNNTVLLLPPLIEHVVKYALVKLFFPMRDVGFLAFLTQNDGFSTECVLQYATTNELTVIEFKMDPKAKCIQCRHLTPFVEISKETNVSKGQRGTSLRFYVLYVIYISVSSLLTLFAHSVAKNAIGISSLILPIPAYVYFVVSTLVALAFSFYCNDFSEQLQSACYDQRRIALKNAFTYSEQFDKSVLRITGITNQSFIEEQLLNIVAPSSLWGLFATTQGAALANSFWDSPVQSIDDLPPFVICRNKSTIQLCRKNGKTKKKNFQKFIIHCAKWFTSTSFLGPFGGPSFNLTVLCYALFWSADVVWKIYCLTMLTETLRLAIYTFFAWIWAPRHYSNLVLERPDCWRGGWCLKARQS